MGDYLQNYGDIEVQRRMVSDGIRTDAFADAIREVVRPGDVVLDVGTGTGVLAMLAARAGAKRVYAVDASDIARVATDLVAKNGLDDVVRVSYGEASQLEVDERPNVLISEWLGSFGLVEGMLDDVLEVRDRLLEPGGWMVPAGLQVMLAPIGDPVMYGHDGPGFWRHPVHGLDFSSLEAAELRQGRALQTWIPSASALSAGAPIVTIEELTRARAAEAWRRGEVEFVIERDGVLDAFAGWFVARLSPTVFLDTGPGEPETHWRQTYLPFSPRPVTRGSKLTVAFETAPHPDNRRDVELTLRVGETTQRYRIE